MPIKLLHTLMCGTLLAAALATPAVAEPKVKVIMTVDWEGRNLDPQNLAAMRVLRADYPQV